MSKEFELVLDNKNIYWSDDENFMIYFVEIESHYLTQLLRCYWFLTKEQIFKELGFGLLDDEINEIYVYGLEAKYLYELSCSYVTIYVKKVFRNASDNTKGYLIGILLESD